MHTYLHTYIYIQHTCWHPRASRRAGVGALRCSRHEGITQTYTQSRWHPLAGLRASMDVAPSSVAAGGAPPLGPSASYLLQQDVRSSASASRPLLSSLHLTLPAGDIIGASGLSAALVGWVGGWGCGS